MPRRSQKTSNSLLNSWRINYKWLAGRHVVASEAIKSSDYIIDFSYKYK
jgi:hypothetical protein